MLAPRGVRRLGFRTRLNRRSARGRSERGGSSAGGSKGRPCLPGGCLPGGGWTGRPGGSTGKRRSLALTIGSGRVVPVIRGGKNRVS